MLTDEEILILREDKEYKSLNNIGWKWLISSCLNEEFEVKSDISASKKAIFFVAKRLIVVKELAKCRQRLIEQFIDSNDDIPKTPQEVRLICEAEKNTNFWMRFDEDRIRILFDAALALLKDHQFRVLISAHAKAYRLDKKERLNSIIMAIDELKFDTLDLILRESLMKKSQGLENHRMDYEEVKARRAAYYKKLEGGTIGSLNAADLSQETVLPEEAEVRQLPPAPEDLNG